jgi:hypothetical protein
LGFEDPAKAQASENEVSEVFRKVRDEIYEYSKLAAATMESTLTLGRTVSIRNARPPRGWVSWNVVHFDLLGLLGLTGSVAVAGSGYKA